MENNIIDPDYSSQCDYESQTKRIKDIFRRYHEYDDDGNPNEEYDPNFTAQEALDAIHELVGDI